MVKILKIKLKYSEIIALDISFDIYIWPASNGEYPTKKEVDDIYALSQEISNKLKTYLKQKNENFSNFNKEQYIEYDLNLKKIYSSYMVVNHYFKQKLKDEDCSFNYTFATTSKDLSCDDFLSLQSKLFVALYKEENPNLSEMQIYKIKKLDINNPEYISFLENLNIETIYLEDQNIEDISFLKNLKKLKNLSLRNNKIKNISVLKELKKLKVLDLGNNKITDVSILENLRELEELYLQENYIYEFSLKKLDKLEVLYLSDNFLKEGEFPNSLKELYLENNKLPYFYHALDNLKILNISNNNMGGLSLPNLKNLKELNISDNKLWSVEIEKVINIERIDISNNNFESLSFIEKTPKLKILNAYNNRISELNLSSKTIKKLNLSGNYIKEVSLDLPKIKELYFTDSRLKEIPKTIENLITLEYLDFSENKIEDISKLNNLSKLKKLSLSDNKIKQIPKLDKLIELNNFDISENEDIKNIINLKHLINVKKLNIIHLNMETISKNEVLVLNKLEKLKELYILNNKIFTVTGRIKIKAFIQELMDKGIAVY